MPNSKELLSAFAVLNKYEQKLLNNKNELVLSQARIQSKLDVIKEIRNELLSEQASNVIASSVDSFKVKTLNENEINSLNTAFQNLTSNNAFSDLLNLRNPWELWPQDLGDPS